MSKDTCYAGGIDLNFFESATLEPITTGTNTQKAEAIGRNVLRILMMGWQDDWKKLATWDIFKAIFVDRDHELTKGMRLAFQQGFNNLFRQLQNRTLTQAQQNQAQLFLANCLTLLPFSDITPYESFTIPQYLNNTWQMVEYRVVPIELTPTTGLSKLWLDDKDRVFAYGLEPITNEAAESHLIFMGTTYPAGQGFVTQIDTDLEAFETAGKKLYRSGYRNISNWLDKQSKKVHVCGTSLGGSLSLLLAIDKGDKLSRVDALNPPGLYNAFRKSRFDNWDKLKNKPQVIVQKQANDPVSKFGVWKDDWTVVHVVPPKDKQGTNAVVDHALNYAGFADTQFIALDPKLDNEERKSRDFILYALTRSLVSYLFLLPYRILVLPILRYVKNNPLLVVYIAALAVLSVFFPPLLPALIAISVMVVVVESLMALKTLFDKPKIVACQDPKLPRNQALDTYGNITEVNVTLKELDNYKQAKKMLNNEEVDTRVIEDKIVTYKATKAEIIDLKQTVRLVNQFGLNKNNPEFMERLREVGAEYSAGKLGQ
ncbi:MAG: hypothetical protein WC627_00450 [Legionella sp.]|jgi:pimeloyl-ACP methyl ester carboxylesterase